MYKVSDTNRPTYIQLLAMLVRPGDMGNPDTWPYNAQDIMGQARKLVAGEALDDHFARTIPQTKIGLLSMYVNLANNPPKREPREEEIDLLSYLPEWGISGISSFISVKKREGLYVGYYDKKKVVEAKDLKLAVIAAWRKEIRVVNGYIEYYPIGLLYMYLAELSDAESKPVLMTGYKTHMDQGIAVRTRLALVHEIMMQIPSTYAHRADGDGIGVVAIVAAQLGRRFKCSEPAAVGYRAAAYGLLSIAPLHDDEDRLLTDVNWYVNTSIYVHIPKKQMNKPVVIIEQRQKDFSVFAKEVPWTYGRVWSTFDLEVRLIDHPEIVLVDRMIDGGYPIDTMAAYSITHQSLQIIQDRMQATDRLPTIASNIKFIQTANDFLLSERKFARDKTGKAGQHMVSDVDIKGHEAGTRSLFIKSPEEVLSVQPKNYRDNDVYRHDTLKGRDEIDVVIKKHPCSIRAMFADDISRVKVPVELVNYSVVSPGVYQATYRVPMSEVRLKQVDPKMLPAYQEYGDKK